MDYKNPQHWLIAARVLFGLSCIGLGVYAVISNQISFREYVEIGLATLLTFRGVEGVISAVQSVKIARMGQS